jgi:WD40 repeat protein
MDTADENGDVQADIARMQAGLRRWVLRAGSGSGRRLRELPSPALLSIVCAAAVSPLIAVGAGLTGAAVIAGGTVLSSLGGGVLSSVIANALDYPKLIGTEHGLSSVAELENEIAAEIGRTLDAGGARARTLRAEIGAVLERIDAGGMVLQAGMDTGDRELRDEVLAVVKAVCNGFAEMGFLINDVARAAGQIQRNLDEQGANVRAIIDQNDRESADIRLIREDLAAILRHGPAPEARGVHGEPAPRWVYGCPYRGLLPFREADAQVFFGRELRTADLAVRVGAQLARGGPIVVSGASGAGKSSLLRAGLLPALARGVQVEGSEHWLRRVITPASDPLMELAACLAALGSADTAEVRDRLARHPQQAQLEVRRALVAAGARSNGQVPSNDDGVRLVLIVDQFEQVFTLSPGAEGEAGRRAFIAALCAAAARPAEPHREEAALVVIAVRGDFWERCAAYPELAGALQEGPFVVGPMTESEIRLAINGPAEAAGLRIDPALTDTIIGDLRTAGGDDNAGVLPLLSHAMSLTWERREGDRLTSRGYAETGGLSQAVRVSADIVYDALPAQQQALAREFLINMTITGRDGRLTRRPVTTADLRARHPDADGSAIDAVVETFTASRLMVLDDGKVQIAHDALLHAWPRLRGWLEEDQAAWILHGQLVNDASAWHDHEQDPSYLYRGSRLAAFQEALRMWAADPARYPSLTSAQRGFLQACQRAAARGKRRRRALAAALSILLIASCAATAGAIRAAQSADQQRRQAVSVELAAESEQLDSTNPTTAALLAVAAMRIAPTAQAEASLLDILAQPQSGTLGGKGDYPLALAYSPNGSLIATADTDGTTRLWDAATHRQIGAPITVRGVKALGVAFNPDGKILATADTHGTARLWDVATRRQISAPITVGGGPVDAVEFSPDGKILVTADFDGTARLWDIATRRQIGAPITAGAGPVAAVAFSPDGKILATVNNNGTARLWDVATQRRIGTLDIPGLVAENAVAFSPDGKILATIGNDGEARLWSVATQRQIGTAMFAGAENGYGLEFSPHGDMLATASSTGAIRLWNVATHHLIRTFQTALPQEPGVVAFSPAGNTLASTAFGSPATLWNLDMYQQIGTPILNRLYGPVPGVAFSPDGRILAISYNTVHLWDIAAHRQIGAPIGIRTPGAFAAFGISGVLNAAFSPDGKILATVYNDKVQLWDIATRRKVAPPITFKGGDMFDAAFSPSGKVLAVVQDGTVRLWDIATRRQVGPPIAGGLPAAVAFSPSGKLLATADNDGTVRLWDIATRRQVGPPIVTGGEGVVGVAFSPGGEILASQEDDGTVRLWDIATRRQVGPAITLPPADGLVGPGAVAFSPDGKTLATAGIGTGVRLWDVAFPGDLMRAACSIASGTITPYQWKLYVSSEPYEELCS